MTDTTEKRPQFGNRLLEDSSKVFEHNSWDNVVWDEALAEQAEEKVRLNSQNKVSSELQEKYDTEADRYWDEFYKIHQNRFFKDRNWLRTEFPELFPEDIDLMSSDSSRNYPGHGASYKILEVGCGVGNTVFPLVKANHDKNVYVYCCDFSKEAVDILKENELYHEDRCHAFVSDVSDDKTEFPFPEASLDVIVMIFVLSAIHPDRLQSTITSITRFLKPGGYLLIRDYGKYDLAQMRFKDGQCLSENFYVRGDGTRVYFFTQDEFRSLCLNAGYEEIQNHIDRRLIVNRGRQLKMYRVWIQCKYKKK